MTDGPSSRSAHGRAGLRVALLTVGGVLGVLFASSGVAGKPSGDEEFAKVGNTVITVGEYAMALREEARRRFYHGRPGENELAQFQREVADKLIERELLVQEAARRRMKIDSKPVDAELARQRERARQAGGGAQPDEKFWRALRKRLEQEQVVTQFKGEVRGAIPADEKTVRAYYSAHPEKFTEPAADRVSVILLKVDASAPNSVWTAARDEAGRLVKQIRAGANFAELARIHSADPSASKGGDMGYMHEGRLGQGAEAAIDKLQPGQITDPVMVLEGIAIFRLDGRRAATLNSFDAVRERATKLWVQEEEARRWQQLIARLRAGTMVRITEKYLDPRGGQTTQHAPAKGRG